jgi:hypothetical protein
MSASNPFPFVWFLLLDSVTGKPYKGTTVSFILRSCIDVLVVDQFREAVRNSDREAAVLSNLKASELIVYKNKTDFDNRKELCSFDSLRGLETTEENALIVLVPSTSTIIHGLGNQNITFVEALVRGGIHKPNQKVLDTIVKCFPDPLKAAVLCGSIETCVSLYRTVKVRGAIQNDLKV